MEQFDFSSLNNVLGIHSPWAIKSVGSDSRNAQVLVQVETQKKKKRFPFFEGKKSDEQIEGSWLYQPIGSFRSIIKAQTSPVANNIPINDEILGLPAFVGHAERSYSNYVRQQVALLQLKGLENSVIAPALQIEEKLVDQIFQDINLSTPKVRSLVYLPTEIDPIWDKVLADKIHIRTSVLPLKLLLSKLKLASVRGEKSGDNFEMVSQLRNFFISNAHLMSKEIDQLCGFDNEKMKKRVHQSQSRQRLVLPSVKNPLWLDLLSGKTTINSQSVPLNLLISRQRMAFLHGNSAEDKIEAINMLREYFRKNYRSLKSELLAMNRAMETRAKSQWRLPDPDHEIWQKILDDKDFISSDHIAYKLLLAKLRSQVSMDKDPVVKLEAAQRIRTFLHQNQKSMRNELNTLRQYRMAV